MYVPMSKTTNPWSFVSNRFIQRIKYDTNDRLKLNYLQRKDKRLCRILSQVLAVILIIPIVLVKMHFDLSNLGSCRKSCLVATAFKNKVFLKSSYKLQSNKTWVSSSMLQQKGHKRFPILKFSHCPVSHCKGATAHLNLLNADLCFESYIILQHSSVLKSVLKWR